VGAMIELTRASNTNERVWVNPNAINYIEQTCDKQATVIYLRDNDCVRVLEKPQFILNVIEMLRKRYSNDK